MSKTDLTVSPRQSVPKKYPPGGCGVAPCKQSPRIMIYYAPIAKAIRQSRTSPAEAFPLPPFCYALPAVLFLAFCIDRTRRAFNRIAREQKQKQSRKQTQRKSKSKAQAKRGSVIYSNAITKKQAKKGNRQAKTERANKHKQESLQACLLL